MLVLIVVSSRVPRLGLLILYRISYRLQKYIKKVKQTNNLRKINFYFDDRFSKVAPSRSLPYTLNIYNTQPRVDEKRTPPRGVMCAYCWLKRSG